MSSFSSLVAARAGLQPANELIAQQGFAFKTKFDEAIGRLMQEKDGPTAQRSKAMKDVVKILNDQFNANFVFHVDTRYPPCCFPLIASLDTPLTAESGKLERTAWVEQGMSQTKFLKDIRGGLDLKTAKLSGDFSKIELPIHFKFKEMQHPKATPGAVAGVIMHEVGHLILAFEFMTRTFRASQLLAALHQSKTNRETTAKYQDDIKTVADALAKSRTSAATYEEILSLEDETVKRVTVLSTVYGDLASDFGYNDIAAPNYERLADNFATRFGYTSDLQSYFLDTLPDFVSFLTTQESRMPQFIEVVLGTLDVAWYGVKSSAMAGAIGGAIVGFQALAGGATVGALLAPVLLTAITLTAIGTVLTMMGFASMISPSSEWSYDRFTWRMERIREAAVEQLKDRDLSPMVRKQILNQIQRMTENTKGMQEKKTIMNTIVMLFESNKKREAAMQLERNIERLTNNDLFVGGNRLRGL